MMVNALSYFFGEIVPVKLIHSRRSVGADFSSIDSEFFHIVFLRECTCITSSFSLVLRNVFYSYESELFFLLFRRISQ